MPEYKVGRPTQEQYDSDHNALIKRIAALERAQQTTPTAKRAGGLLIPYAGASTGSFSVAAPTVASAGGTIIVGDGAGTSIVAVMQLNLDGFTLTATAGGGGATVDATFGGIDDA
jgi:hypothetical protein